MTLIESPCVEIEISNVRTPNRSKAIIARVDGHAMLTVIPTRLLQRLGIEKMRPVRFVLADGRRETRYIGNALVAVNGECTPCRVVFGQPGDRVRLGLTALSQLGLTVDTAQQRLIPTVFRL